MADRTGVYFSGLPAGISSWVLEHQFQSDRNWTRFDYLDHKLNLEAYGQLKPPPFHYENITSKNLAMIYSKDDVFSNQEYKFLDVFKGNQSCTQCLFD